MSYNYIYRLNIYISLRRDLVLSIDDVVMHYLINPFLIYTTDMETNVGIRTMHIVITDVSF